MDDDYNLYLGDNISGSNTTDDDIDSDLEDKLYAAVFHSNEISTKNEDIAGYNNFTCLTDVIGCWKNLPKDKNCADLLIADDISLSQDPHESVKSYDRYEGGEIYSRKTNSCFNYKENSFNNDNRLKNKDDICYDGNKISEDHLTSSDNNSSNRNCNVIDDNEESRNDIYEDYEIQTGIANIQDKKKSEKERERDNIFVDNREFEIKNNMKKKQKYSSKKIYKSKDYSEINEYTAAGKEKLTTNNINVEIDLFNNSAALSVSQDANESSDIKAEEEIKRNNESLETEIRVFSIDNSTIGIEPDLDKPPSFSLEEKLKTVESKESEATIEDSDDAADVKPEDKEKLEKKTESMDRRASISPSNSSSEKSSPSSSGKNTRDLKNRKNKRKNLCSVNYQEEIIISDDSEGSICEIPVPPKPRPLTINLEDSECSSSSFSSPSSSSSSSSSSASSSSSSSSISCTENVDKEISAELLTPEKLVESYKNAVSNSKTKSGYQETEITPNKKQKNPNITTSNATFVSDDSMTDGEQENWGIIAGCHINKEKSIPNSDISDNRLLEISDSHLPSEILLQDNRSDIIGDTDNSINTLFEERENSFRESSENIEKISLDLGPEKQLEVEKSTTKMDRGNNEKDKEGLGDYENITDGDTLIINAGNAQRSYDNEEISESLEILNNVKTPESRKRSINDNGKKNKQQNSPKKAKNSDELASPIVSIGKSSKSRMGNNKENNKNKEKNYAAHNFFKPMTNDMENYYNKSWGGENFDIDIIRSQMPRDPKQWSVLNEDLLGYQQRRSRYWTEIKCRNCNISGHRAAECTEKRKLPSCHMCGTQGHKEPRCPHKMCLGCGTKQKTYMQVCKGCRRAWCKGCKSYGHLEDSCPDLWRRYHGTTSHRDSNTNLLVEGVMKPQHLLSCCNCAKRGHDSTTCNNYRWSRHFPTPAYVSNYNMGPDYIQEPPVHNITDLEYGETREKNYGGKRKTNNEITHTITSGNDNEIIIRSDNNVNDKECESLNNLESNIVLEKCNETPKIIENIGEKSKKLNEAQKNSKEIIITDSCLKNLNKKNDGVLFTFTSKLIDDNFMRSANFGECNVPLFHAEYKRLVESNLSNVFLQNLIELFPMKIVIKRSSIGQITMNISSTIDLHSPIHMTIMDWLNREKDEQNRFLDLALPNNENELVILLKSKLNELEQNLGNPIKLYNSIENMKSELGRLKRQSISGKKKSTCSKRARVVAKLANSQCRLNMILFGQYRLKQSSQSYEFLKNALNILEKGETESFLSAATYLQIVHHYNIIFAAYTPKNLSKLMTECSTKPSLHKIAIPKLKNRYDSTYTNFLSSLNKSNENETRNKNNKPSASSIGSKHSSNILRSEKTLAQRLKDIGESSSSGFNANDNCSGVEKQFIVPETDGIGEANRRRNPNFDTNPNLNSNILTASEIPSLMDLTYLDNNYYNNVEYNSSVNINFQRRGVNEFSNNFDRQADYVALDNRDLRNNDYNLGRDYDSFRNDYHHANRKSYGKTYNERGETRGRRRRRSNSRNRGINENIIDINSPINYDLIETNSSLERNRWAGNSGDGYDNRNAYNISGQDMFYSDRQATGSTEVGGQLYRNDNNFLNIEGDKEGLDSFSIDNNIERSENLRYDLPGPSTSFSGNRNNQLRNNSHKNNSVKTSQNIDNKSKKKKKKKHKRVEQGNTKLPPYLLKRAAKNISKYIDMGYPRITQAAKALQKKLNDKELTLQCVLKFEGLVKQKLKKTDYLL